MKPVTSARLARVMGAERRDRGWYVVDIRDGRVVSLTLRYRDRRTWRALLAEAITWLYEAMTRPRADVSGHTPRPNSLASARGRV